MLDSSKPLQSHRSSKRPRPGFGPATSTSPSLEGFQLTDCAARSACPAHAAARLGAWTVRPALDTGRVARVIARVRRLAAVSLALLACTGCQSRLGTSPGEYYPAPAARSEDKAPSGQAQEAPPIPPVAETAPGLRLSTLEGGRIVAKDGQFLGTITGRSHKESIANPYGDYGSSYSPTSMFNRSGTYGSPHSGKGAMHPHTPFPPRIYVDGKPVAYVTANRSFKPSIHPDALRDFAQTRP